MLGRNDKCYCGSGKKYQKCCLADAADGGGNGFSLIDSDNPGVMMTLDGDVVGLYPKKISAMVLELVQWMIDTSETQELRRTAIMFGIAAWNLSLVEDKDRTESAEKLLAGLMKKETPATVREGGLGLLCALADHKREAFPDVKQFITGFEIEDDGEKELNLTVITISYEGAKSGGGSA